VILGPFRGAAEILGMATGTRDLGLFSGVHLVTEINALVFSGGSAFGLGVSDGVMDWLAEQGEGFQTGVAPVPIVPAAVIFDLAEGIGRPGPAEGREACESASSDPVLEGRVGAGAGATVGKILGVGRASPGGVGTSSAGWRGGTVASLAVVNALGDVVGQRGEILAGVRAEDGSFPGTERVLGDQLSHGRDELGGPFPRASGEGPKPGSNTTLAVVATDLPLSYGDLRRICRMAATAFPRSISPVQTPFDGDLLFALATGDPGSDMEAPELLSLGILARDLTAEAIRRGVTWPGHLPEVGERFA
jgi:L-aminopeptidase/D-esterase-like protein